MLDQNQIDKEQGDFPVDVFEDEDKMRVIAELPNIVEEEIRLDLNDDTLFMFAGRYHREIKLPRDAEGISWKSYNSGILEIILA